MTNTPAEVVVAACRLLTRACISAYGTARLRELGRWALGGGFPLASQGQLGLPILFCKVGDTNLPGNEIWIRSTRNTIDAETARRLRVTVHPPGTVVFPKIGGAIATNKRRILSRPAAIDNNMLGLVPEEGVDSVWLYHLLRGLEFSQFQTGTSVPALRQSVLAEIEVPRPPVDAQRQIARFLTWLETADRPLSWNTAPALPVVLSGQRRIVARIEELAGGIREARGLRRDSTAVAKALLQSMLHNHFVLRSADWLSIPMAEAVTMDDRQVDPTLPVYSGLPHISGENMESGTCRLLPWRTAEEDGVRSGNYLFSPGSILYSKIRPYLRKAVYVDFQGVCSADVYPMRVVSKKLEPLFVRWSLVAEPFTEYAVRLSGRTRMPKLNRKQFFGFCLTHPLLSEQRRIVTELDALQAKVDELKRLQAETQAELDALLPSILDRAFKGGL